jgi:hypothetical protein
MYQAAQLDPEASGNRAPPGFSAILSEPRRTHLNAQRDWKSIRPIPRVAATSATPVCEVCISGFKSAAEWPVRRYVRICMSTADVIISYEKHPTKEVQPACG